MLAGSSQALEPMNNVLPEQRCLSVLSAGSSCSCGLPRLCISKGHNEAHSCSLLAAPPLETVKADTRPVPAAVCANRQMAGEASLSCLLPCRFSLYEPVEFIRHHMMDKLDWTTVRESVAIHVPCSSKKMGIEAAFATVAAKCAKEVVPSGVPCCGEWSVVPVSAASPAASTPMSSLDGSSCSLPGHLPACQWPRHPVLLPAAACSGTACRYEHLINQADALLLSLQAWLATVACATQS